MANLTDPLIRSIQGTDPQNLMEYITRQKIYDSRFWKEECFGLTTADVSEKAASTLTNVGGTIGPIRKPTRFLCLVLKLLQLQPDMELIQTFIEQRHFKYLRALGAFYLRLTGRPQDIYDHLEPMYADYSKLRYRDVSEWTVLHMDEFVDELLTKSTVCGISLPRLPGRSTLVEAGYVDDVPPSTIGGISFQRPTALRDVLEDAGGVKAYLELKMNKEILDMKGGRMASTGNTATTMWELRYGTAAVTGRGHGTSRWMVTGNKAHNDDDNGRPFVDGGNDNEESEHPSIEIDGDFVGFKRKSQKDDDDDRTTDKKKKKKRKTKKSYGTLFTKTTPASHTGANEDGAVGNGGGKFRQVHSGQPEEGSDEYWNEERAKLGLKPLNK